MRPGLGWGRGWGLGSTSFSPTSAAPCEGKVPSLEPRLRFRAGFNLQHIQVVPEPGGSMLPPETSLALSLEPLSWPSLQQGNVGLQLCHPPL